MFFINKSQWLLAFILWGTTIASQANLLNSSIEKSNRLNLSKQEKWQALLHLKHGGPRIKDAKFLLSKKDFSPQAELNATLSLFFQKPDEAICRFPARLFYLNHHLKITGDSIPALAFKKCSKLNQFLSYVPFDKVYLNFASEVLSSASSMMGHTFLKVDGLNKNNNQVSHSISFFTQFSSFNPLTLIYDGTIGGMPGFFMIRPSAVDHNQYINIEKRNLWTYELAINPFNKELLQLHLWELKDIHFKYLFQNYNCATLTLYLLAIVEPSIITEEILFVSPIDVIKAAKKYNLLLSENVYLARDWELTMLSQQLPVELVNQVEALILKNRNIIKIPLNISEQLLLKRYLSLIEEKSNLWGTLPKSTKESLKKLHKHLSKKNSNIDLADYKKPLESPQDSIFSSSLAYDEKNSYVDFTFLPASHYLHGDNKQLFMESELNIGTLSLRVKPNTNNIKIQNITLYGVKSYIPSTNILPQLSGEFYLGYKRLLSPSGLKQGLLELSGSVGKSYKIHKDILVFGLIGAGLSSDINHSSAHIEIKTGSITNLIYNSKAIYEYSLRTGQFNSAQKTHKNKLSISWLASKNNNMQISLISERIRNKHLNTLKLSYHSIF